MNCIDAVEGTVKAILQQLLDENADSAQGDSEYIREAKAVLDATSTFVHQNPEISDHPGVLHDVLYRYSKEIWMAYIRNSRLQTDESATVIVNDASDIEYDGYLFDQIYHRGHYPL